jgi:BMFP domain-containing protein YqiC
MTTGPNRLLDEFAKLMTDAAGAAQGVRREVETAFRAQAERILNSMDVVQREEFEAVREMALKARAENKDLAARIAALEARIEAMAPSVTAEPSAASAKSRAKK